MAPGELDITKTEHLPNEQTLLVRYGLSQTGTWIYSLCNCGYRGVCEDEWTIMIPNHQHPQHTDGRPGQPIYVSQGGLNGTFAWNYGGIVGISPESFDEDHSYLVQLTIQELNACSGAMPTGHTDPTGTVTGSVIVSGFTGKSGPGTNQKPFPIKKPKGKGPPAPIPKWGKVPGNVLNPRNFGPGDPRTTTTAGNTQGTVDPVKETDPTVVGDLRGVLPITFPVDLYPHRPGHTLEVVSEGLISPLPNELTQSTKSNFKEIETEPGGWLEVNPGGSFFAGPPESSIFGDGENAAKAGREQKNQANAAVDLSDLIKKGNKLDIPREIDPDSATRLDRSIAFPTDPDGIPLGVDVPSDAPFEAGGTSIVGLDSNAGLLGVKADAARHYHSDAPVPEQVKTFDSESAIGQTLILVSRGTVFQGEQVAVNASFIPNEGASVRVRGKLYAVDANKHSYLVSQAGPMTATNSSPGVVFNVLRTDFMAVGRMAVTAVFQDMGGKTAGIASTHITIVGATKEGDGETIDTYTDPRTDDISQGLRGLTKVGTTPVELRLAKGGERSLIYSVVDISKTRRFSFVVAQTEDTNISRGIKGAAYNSANVSESTIVTKLLDDSGDSIGQLTKSLGYRILEADGPVEINGEPAFADEHLAGHVPAITTASEVILNMHKFGPAANEEMDIRVYTHTDFELKRTSRTTLTRSSTTVDGVTTSMVALTYATPYSSEEIWLLVKGYASDVIPDTLTYYKGVSNVSGNVTFSGVVATKEQWIGLYSSPFRFTNEFYKERLGL
ncbi:MAG: hypothetical protein ACXABY_00175 [Candidatus Thorarchaeota archaeon]|jgi:hypothetical protein